jgi:uncharacterized protein
VPALPALAQSIVRGAVGNARRATAELQTAVRDRTALQPSPPDDDAGPGALAALSREEALDLLAAHSVGRLCYVARAGVPDVVPVNYAVRGGEVLVRSGPGPKLQAAERGDVVAFEVDELDEAAQTGRSVVVVGPARRLTETEVDALDQGPHPWAVGPRRHVLAIRVQRVTGRRLG